ncbi:hypothetical protein HanRHA438_Chr01g0013241 [Helianthus annuus]|nr:hypothetical protein HanRHA438_Chr01g0013241 [Helianthus annuus]
MYSSIFFNNKQKLHYSHQEKTSHSKQLCGHIYKLKRPRKEKLEHTSRETQNREPYTSRTEKLLHSFQVTPCIFDLLLIQSKVSSLSPQLICLPLIVASLNTLLFLFFQRFQVVER